MLEIEMDLNPTIEQLKRWIKGIENEVIKDLRPFWDSTAQPIVAEEIARVFASEGYGRWPPLSPNYAKYKGRLFPGKRMLRRQDTYYKSATRRGEEGNLYVSKPDEMVWGISLNWFSSQFGFPYPVVHEHGRKDGTVPQRQVFGLALESNVLQNNLVAGLKKYLEKTVAKETRKHFKRK